MSVKSTYNFIPAPTEDEVYKPKWAKQVSHDIPFSDGESGEIELKITAQTPIFIRNGHAKGVEENEFSHYFNQKGQKQYFIPGSSLKGMFRNVLEIMTFSRLNKNLVNDDRYSFRDLTRDSEYMNSYDTTKVKAGWLSEDENGKWIIKECKYYHIHHTEVDKILKTTFRRDFLNRNPEKTTALFKYEKCKDKTLESTFSVIQGKNKSLAIFDAAGKRGTIVFTGQSSQRKERDGNRPSGKVHEFVFIDELSIDILEVSEKTKTDFKFIYLDHDKNNISKDWESWRYTLENGGEVPVFFNKEADKIKHFGLSFMYKLPYDNSVHEMSPLKTYESTIDLATAIFGSTEKNEAIKGRVMFSHAVSINGKKLTKTREILGAPKASFTPYYLTQTDKTAAKTYQDNINIKGFKKYPIHSKVVTGNYSLDQKKNEKVFTEFTPLAEGTEFRCKIRYHNLKMIELGALVSSISFHQNSEQFYHSLGSAKSLGYGSIKVELINIGQFDESLQAFEHEMNGHVSKFQQNSWCSSPQIKEILAMSKLPVSEEVENNLTYPSIGKDGSNGTKDNEFIQIKINKSYLQSYSEINECKGAKSLLKRENIEKWKAIEEEKIRLINAKEKAKQDAFQNEKNKAKSYLNEFDFENSLKCYKEAMSIENDNSLAAFEKEIELKKAEKAELDAYQEVISANTVVACTNFISNFPLSIYKLEIEKLASKLKANSAFPDRLAGLIKFDQFSKESETWIKKLENKTILGSGFEQELIGHIVRIGKIEKEDKKLVKDWNLGGRNEKKIAAWFGDKKASEIITEI